MDYYFKEEYTRKKERGIVKVTKGTVVRTIMTVLVVFNIILKALGYDAIQIDESQLGELVEAGVSVGVILLSFWKNNSYSKNAIKADEYLKKLNEFNEEVVYHE